MSKKDRKEAIIDKQFEMAMDGSVEMLKWLGINICGQSNQPTDDDNQLPSGFNITTIPNEYEQEIVQEFKKHQEDFMKWKVMKDVPKN